MTQQEASKTKHFAAFLRHLRPAGLTPVEASAAVDILTDGIAVAALGAQEPGPRMLQALALETGAHPLAGLIAAGGRTDPVSAARANGAALHVLDFEPMWNPANHAVSTTLPAVLALAERQAAKGGDEGAPRPDGVRILEALALGIEAQARLRLASGQFEPANLIFHPPGAVGPIGAAVACGFMLGLDEDGLAHAMGIAASRTGGLLANVGSMTKAFHCGQAAAAGLESAIMAAQGFTADADALFGPRGYGAALFGREMDIDQLTEPRGALHILDPGPAYKLYPSQYGTHFVISAALDARQALAPGASIQRVRIVSPPMPYVDRPFPASGLAGKFSFQYTAAVALLDGAIGVASFTDERRFAGDVVDLLKRITIQPDPNREGRFDRMVLDMEVELEDGRIVTGHCDGPPGIWTKPLSDGALQTKTADLFGAVWGASAAEALILRLARFAALRDTEVAELLRDLCAPPTGQKA